MSAAQNAKCLAAADNLEKQKEKDEEKTVNETRGVTWSGLQQDRRAGALPEGWVKLFQRGTILTQVNREHPTMTMVNVPVSLVKKTMLTTHQQNPNRRNIKNTNLLMGQNMLKQEFKRIKKNYLKQIG